MNPKVDFFFNKAEKWQKEYEKLRIIVLECGLTEELKWGVPCYTFQQNNIVLIHGFKEYCALLFHKGVLLNDTHNILIQQTENVQSARQLRFSNLEEIDTLESTIKSYIFEAIEVEKAGLQVKLKKTTEFRVPEEFRFGRIFRTLVGHHFPSLSICLSVCLSVYLSSCATSRKH